jgi:hypothetical protein
MRTDGKPRRPRARRRRRRRTRRHHRRRGWDAVVGAVASSRALLALSLSLSPRPPTCERERDAPLPLSFAAAPSLDPTLRTNRCAMTMIDTQFVVPVSALCDTFWKRTSTRRYVLETYQHHADTFGRRIRTGSKINRGGLSADVGVLLSSSLLSLSLRPPPRPPDAPSPPDTRHELEDCRTSDRTNQTSNERRPAFFTDDASSSSSSPRRLTVAVGQGAVDASASLSCACPWSFVLGWASPSISQPPLQSSARALLAQQGDLGSEGGQEPV